MKELKLVKAIIGEEMFNEFVGVADEIYPKDKTLHDKLVWCLSTYYIDHPNSKGVAITVYRE